MTYRKKQGMRPLWMEIITDDGLRKGRNLSEKQHQMFSMASYNVDRFREFVFQSRFLQLFQLGDEEEKVLESDDTALLGLGFKWLSFSLLNKPSLILRQGGKR